MLATSTVKTKVIKRKPQDFEAMVEAPVKPPRAHSASTVSEEIAQSSLFYKNYPVAELRSVTTYAARLWHVDQYFPHAKGKPLYVDFVRQLADKVMYQNLLNDYKSRSEVMKKSGLRYLFLTHDMDVTDAIEQLGEL